MVSSETRLTPRFRAGTGGNSSETTELHSEMPRQARCSRRIMEDAMKKYRLPIAVSSAALLSILVVAAAGAAPPETEFAYTAGGQVKFPADYRQWVFLSSGIGMTYGPIGSANRTGPPMFDNVFVNQLLLMSWQEHGCGEYFCAVLSRSL
jgi:hypothetical protein